MIRKLAIIITILLLGLLVILLLFNNKNFNIKKIDYNYASEYYDINQNNELLEADHLYEIAKITYYESETTAGFYSYPLNNNDINLYDITTVLRTADNMQMQITSNQLNDLKLLFSTMNIDFTKLPLHELNDYVYIANFLNEEIDKQSIYNMLILNYSVSDNLFYFENEGEDLDTKISATYLTIEIIKMLNMSFTHEKEIISTLSNVNKDETFCKNNDLITRCGADIILILELLDYDASSLNQEYQNWLEYWNNKLEIPTEFNFFELINISKLNEVNKYLNYERPIDILLILDLYFERYNNFYKIHELNNEFVVDYSIIYYLSILVKDTNKEIPFKQQLQQYFNTCVETNFKKITDVNINRLDTYYGLRIAKETNFIYNNEKLYKQILLWKQETNNMTLIKSYVDILDIYFDILLIEEENLQKFNNDEVQKIKSRVEKFLNSIDYNDNNNILENITSIQLSLEVFSLLNIDINKSLRDNLIKYINTDEVIYVGVNSIYASELYIISDILKTTININISEIKTKLLVNGGIKRANEEDYNIPDIISTFKMYRIINLDKISSSEKVALNEFVKNLYDDNFYIIGHEDGDYTSLRIIYYALKLS